MSHVNVLFTDAAVEIDGVKYRHHQNGGGLVAETATVDPTAFVGAQARVSGHAQVLDAARIEDCAHVSGNARVTVRAKVCGTSIVSDQAQISGSIEIHDLAVRGDTQLSGTEIVYWPRSQGFFLSESAAQAAQGPRTSLFSDPGVQLASAAQRARSGLSAEFLGKMYD